MVKVGESECSGVLKTCKLLIFRHAKNTENGEIAANWNVSGTCLWAATDTASDDMAAESFGHGLRFRVHLELVIDSSQVEADRVNGHPQLRGGSLIVVPFDEQA